MIDQKNYFDKVTRWQVIRQNQFRSIPDSGIVVNYLDRKFVVLRDVFIPFIDSYALAENFYIKKGEAVLDVGTGCGVLAICAAWKGARRVLAVDNNIKAVENTKLNIKLHGLTDVIETRQSNVYSSMKCGEKYNVIVANLPIRKKKARDLVEASMWDTDLRVNRNFLVGAKNYLEKSGRIYLTQANFGAVMEILELAKRLDLKIRLVGQRYKTNSEIFYAFELTIKSYI